MKLRNQHLAINFDLLERDQMQYFFRPLFWNHVEYKFLSEQEVSSCVQSMGSSISESAEVKDEITTAAVDIPAQESNEASNDILASYNNILQRYKS